MDSLLFSLHATIPVFLLILLGCFLRRVGVLTEAFCQVSDRLVFQVALPVMLLCDMSALDMRQSVHSYFILFCALATTVIFFSLWGLSRLLLRDKSLVGEFVQVSYRSSAAILGCSIIRNLYGTVGAAPLMILGSVPLFNIYAVVVLTMERPGDRMPSLKSAAKHVLKNPIIIGIVLGLLLSYLGVQSFPPILDKTLSSLSALATPLALLSIGANLQLKSALTHKGLSFTAAGIKLLLLPALFLPLAVFCGFTGDHLVALIVMLGGTSTPTCYIMAKNLGHDGQLTISVVVLTTLLSAFSLTLWIFLARYWGLIF